MYSTILYPHPSYHEAVTAQGDGGAAPEAQGAQEARVHPGHGPRVRHHCGRDLEHDHRPDSSQLCFMTHIGLTVGACRGHGVFSKHNHLPNNHHRLASNLLSIRHEYVCINFYFFLLMTYILPLGLGLDWGLVSNVPHTALISRIHSLVRQTRA